MPQSGSKMSEDKVEPSEGCTWVIDSLIQFLSGPVWNKPIAAFIENHCAIFDPDGEHNTPDHRQVHLEYRTLVDSLLGGFVEELQITPTQFQDAVSNQNSNTVARFQPGALLEQIWAASDLPAFNYLMGLHNLELQLQALNSIRSQSGAPISLDYSEDGKLLVTSGEDRLLKHVLRRSMEEAQIMERMSKKYNRLSLAEDMTRPLPTLAKQEAAKMTSPNVATQSSTDQTEVKMVPVVPVSPKRLNDEEIQKRKEYLCRQRDKLLQAKGKPKNASAESKTAESDDANFTEDEHTTQDQESEEALQMRRALVNRLKAEVINKKK